MLTVKQVAEKLRISASLVYSWCEDHLLPHYRMGGKGKRGKILIEEAALDTFLQSRKVEGQARRFRFPRPQAHYAPVAAFVPFRPAREAFPFTVDHHRQQGVSQRVHSQPSAGATAGGYFIGPRERGLTYSNASQLLRFSCTSISFSWTRCLH